MTVNLAYKPFFEVERRKYRFRILNASVSRFFKVALPTRRHRRMIQIANDGNLLPQPGDADRSSTSRASPSATTSSSTSRSYSDRRARLHGEPGRAPGRQEAVEGPVASREALSGNSADPVRRASSWSSGSCANPAQPDVSQVPSVADPEPGSVADPGGARARSSSSAAAPSRPTTTRSRRSSARGASRPTAARHARRRLQPDLGGAAVSAPARSGP